MKNKKKKGFTLVELLVVIAILAILSSVTVVGYMGFTKKAKESVRDQEAKQVETVLFASFAGGKITSGDYTAEVIDDAGTKKIVFSESCKEGTTPMTVKDAALNELFTDLAPLDALKFKIELTAGAGSYAGMYVATQLEFTASNGLTKNIVFNELFK